MIKKHFTKKIITEEHCDYIKDVIKMKRKPFSLVPFEYAKVLVPVSGKPVIQSRKRTGFIGFLLAMTAIVGL